MGQRWYGVAPIGSSTKNAARVHLRDSGGGRKGAQIVRGTASQWSGRGRRLAARRKPGRFRSSSGPMWASWPRRRTSPGCALSDSMDGRGFDLVTVSETRLHTPDRVRSETARLYRSRTAGIVKPTTSGAGCDGVHRHDAPCVRRSVVDLRRSSMVRKRAMQTLPTYGSRNATRRHRPRKTASNEQVHFLNSLSRHRNASVEPESLPQTLATSVPADSANPVPRPKAQPFHPN
jgi:hypothetical protein